MAEDLSECTSVVGLKDLPKVKYVERTHQSSPPPSPPRIKHEPEPLEVPGQSSATPTYRIHPGETFSQINGVHRPVSVATKVAFSPMSPCETHLFDGAWPESKKPPVSSLPYSGIPQQTDDAAQPLSKTNPSKRDGLQVPVAVSQMTIQPSTSRPSSITSCILPPGTKNAASQANSTWFGKDASVQTEEIRVDKRPVKLAVHLLPTHLNSLSEPSVPPKPFVAPAVSPKKSFKQQPHRGPRISMKIPPSSLPFQPMQSLTEASNPTNSRNDSFRDLGKMPLKPVPLPKPTLAPARSVVASNNSKGPLNRSAHFGVSLQNVASRQLAEINDASDDSDHEDGEAQDLAGSMPVLKTIRRFKGPDPSSVISDFAPGSLQRPNPTGSFDAVPTSSISSSRNHSQRGVGAKRSPSRSSSLLKTRSSSPSFGAITSSNFSTQSALPPQVIPKRSSSRIPMSTWGDGAQSPSPDSFATPGSSVLLSSHQRPGTMRKVQSPASIRGKAGNILPQKPRRRTQSPNVTPVDSITFESPERTDLPISELPSPLQQPVAFDWDNRQSTPSKRPETAASWAPQIEESQLVDSIAGTMAGEWMWKYMRKWRSLEMETAERFAARAGDESGGFTLASHGPRHKRWVWLSPYDRTIMWGKKQPTSGTAALGKESRKRESNRHLHQTSSKLTTNSCDPACH